MKYSIVIVIIHSVKKAAQYIKHEIQASTTCINWEGNIWGIGGQNCLGGMSGDCRGEWVQEGIDWGIVTLSIVTLQR